MLASVRDANASGAARRRQRRLRQWLRHERLSVAMALAESTHHSAPRGQKMARAGGRARDELHGHAPDDALPQGRILRHVVGHLFVPSLDVPVPQMVDQLPDIEHFFAALSPDPEQVIEVPKILPLDVPMRAALRVTQLVEQLVEVPTTVSYSSLLRTAEQLVDIPVPGGGGGISGAQGFLPRQSSTALHGSLERISERIVAQNVDFPVGGGLQDFLPGQTSSASSSPADGFTDEPGKGVFRTFPQNKKSAELSSHSGSELPPHPSSSTAAAQQEGSVEWVRLRESQAGKAFFWNRRTNSTVWRAPAGVEVVWFGVKNEEGAVYYWHRDTRVSTYELPPLPPE